MSSAALPVESVESLPPTVIVHPVPRHRGRLVLFLTACLLGLTGTSILFFYGLQASPDLLRDEITYWIISHNVAAHAAVSLYGSPFVLHPPLVFLIEGLALKLTGGPNDFLYGTLSIRWLLAAFGLGTALLMLILATKSIGRLAAICALALYSVDPLVLRSVRRDLLEAPAMFFAVAAVLLLSQTRPGGLRRPALAGAAAGLALLSKEYTGFLLGLIVMQWLWPRTAGRWLKQPFDGLTTSQAAVALAAALAVYALYPLGWLVSGNWALFAQEKGYLLARFLGIIHDTGLNRGNTHLSAVGLLLINMHQYASSYLLLAVGGLSGIWLLLTARRWPTTVVGMWAVVASIWTAFETVHGLAEEEFYYYAIIPAAIATGALLARLLSPLWARHSTRRPIYVAVVAIAAFIAILGFNGWVWTSYYGSPDAAFLQMRRYVDHNLPKRTVIIAGSEMDGPAFGNDTFRLIRLRGANDRALSQYRILLPADIRTLARSGAHYAIVSTKDVYVGYGVMSRRGAAYLHHHGTVVYQTYSSSYWHLQLIRLNRSVWQHGGSGRRS